MFLRLNGKRAATFAMQGLQDGPYPAKPGEVFEVSERDAAIFLVPENALLFSVVDAPEEKVSAKPKQRKASK